MTLVALPCVRAPAVRLDASRVCTTRRRHMRVCATSQRTSTSGKKSEASTIASKIVGSLSALVLLTSPTPALAAQPIEWVFSGGGESIGDILKDSLEESGMEVKRTPIKAPEMVETTGEDGVVTSTPAIVEPEEPSEPIDIAGTAFKFGKLGAILVFADVVTFFVMGRSVLGVMDDGGEEGWKEKMADEIMERAKKKEDAANGGAAGDEETNEDK